MKTNNNVTSATTLNLTPEEQERLSYIQGNTKELALIHQAEETLLEENLDLDQEVRSLQSKLRNLQETIDELTHQLHERIRNELRLESQIEQLKYKLDEQKHERREDCTNLTAHIDYLEQLLKMHNIEFKNMVDIDF